MYLSNVLIVIDPKHPDRNSLQEIVDALRHMEAEVIEVDQHHHVIEAVVAAHEIATVQAIGGVSYVRPVFTYFVPCKINTTQIDPTP
jgi:hypothetical protein